MNLKFKNHEERFSYNHSRFGGGGTAEVSVSADLNPNFKSRETSLTFSAGGISPLVVPVIQQGIVLQSNVSFRIDDASALSSFSSKTSGYSFGGSYPIQNIDVSYQGNPDIVFAEIQFLVRKDYLDVPANELIIDENNLGLTDYFNQKISIGSEYNLYLYSGESLQLTPEEHRLEPVISLDNLNFMFGWIIQKV